MSKMYHYWLSVQTRPNNHQNNPLQCMFDLEPKSPIIWTINQVCVDQTIHCLNQTEKLLLNSFSTKPLLDHILLKSSISTNRSIYIVRWPKVFDALSTMVARRQIKCSVTMPKRFISTTLRLLGLPTIEAHFKLRKRTHTCSDRLSNHCQSLSHILPFDWRTAMRYTSYTLMDVVCLAVGCFRGKHWTHWCQIAYTFIIRLTPQPHSKKPFVRFLPLTYCFVRIGIHSGNTLECDKADYLNLPKHTPTTQWAQHTHINSSLRSAVTYLSLRIYRYMDKW